MAEIVKRSVVVDGRKTSVSLEDEFWDALRNIARSRGDTLSGLVSDISKTSESFSNLSSALRVFALNFYLSQPQPDSPADHSQVSTAGGIRALEKQVNNRPP